MKILGTAALALGILAAPVSFAVAQADTSAVHNSINGDMPRTHDKAATVRVDNNNGLYGHANTNSSDYQGEYNPQR